MLVRFLKQKDNLTTSCLFYLFYLDLCKNSLLLLILCYNYIDNNVNKYTGA